MDKSVIVCRCEEISYEEIEEVITQGGRTFDDIKRITRCGMGACQSKICSKLVAEVIHKQTGLSMEQIYPPRFRMPISPVSLEALATDSQQSSTVKSVLDEIELTDGKVK